MPITSIPTNDRKERFVATAAQTVFPYDFPIYAATDLLVTRVRGSTLTTLINGTDYTVSGVDNQTGGNVTLTAGAQADDIITITSNMPTARAAQFVNGGDLPAAALEAEFNKLRILFQQLATLQSNALIYPFSDLTAPPLPIKEQRANKALAFNAQGEPTAADFAALSHNHIIGNVTGLQTALDGKAATSHMHTSKDIAVVFYKETRSGGGNALFVPRPVSEMNPTTTKVLMNGSEVSSFTLDDNPFNPGVETRISFPFFYTTGTIFEVADVITSPFFDAVKITANQISNATTPGRAILTAANAAAQRTALGLGSGDSPAFSNVFDSEGNVRDLPVTNRTAAYTAALSDTGGQIRISTGGVTIPSGIFSPGQVFSIVNNSASNQTITQAVGVTLRLAGTATTGNRTLAQYGQCTVNCVANNEFIISGPGLT
jgi:hypothetical protein